MFTNNRLHKSKHYVLQKQVKNVKIINLQKLHTFYINNIRKGKVCKNKENKPIF